MERKRLRAGDVVVVNHMGRRFWAQLLEVTMTPAVLPISPITHNISWRTCTPLEVEKVYRALR